MKLTVQITYIETLNDMEIAFKYIEQQYDALQVNVMQFRQWSDITVQKQANFRNKQLIGIIFKSKP